MAKRKGRGRLSSIDLLPIEASDDVFWVAGELRKRERTQLIILQEFNDRLAVKGLGPISATAFSRYSVGKADMLRRSNETREMAAVLTERMEPGQSDDVTTMLAEMVKSLIREAIAHSGEAGFTPKETMNLAAALRSTVSAEKISGEALVKLEARVASKVDETIELVAQEAGLTEQQLKQIRNDVLGVR